MVTHFCTFSISKQNLQWFFVACDLKYELERLKTSIYNTFVLENQPAIYDPDQFVEFCQQSGAPNISNHILNGISVERQSNRRQHLNRIRTVSIIYTMCYCRSQMCNVMQVDHALYLNSNRMTQEGIDTQHRLWHTCSRKTSNRVHNQLSQSHDESIKIFFQEAIQNEWVLVLIIDDFTKIHTNPRPSVKTCNPMNMCTIVVKAFRTLKAIQVPTNISTIHHPDGVNVSACVQAITSPEQMKLLSNSYFSTMNDWATKQFFTPELERHILEEHRYGDETGVRLMKTMEDLHLIDFVELQLKSKEGFSKAYDKDLSSGLETYLRKFVVIGLVSFTAGNWYTNPFYSMIKKTELHRNIHPEYTIKIPRPIQMNVL